MKNVKDLCLALLKADREDEVVELLKDAGYWDNKDAWRLYGDKEGNFAQAGNQSAKPEAALVEKIVNCVDARLMSECLERQIDPESDEAPTSIRDAVARFFEGKKIADDEGGTICNWGNVKRTEHSRFITVAATGGKPTRGKRRQNMCITIADQGEGQSPDRLPRTILSLNEKNKQRIRFVQGKFNMGGSGALRFCGKLGLQLVISRRNPALAEGERGEDPTVDEWGVTVVRREKPSDKSGEPVHSEFTYLAPIGASESPRKGGILRFSADSLPLFPKHDDAYVREVEWATLIKLYEYETNVGQSHITMKDGLLYALERLLPGIALPVRLHECRGYGGTKEKSFETPLSGLTVRLEEGKGDNLEPNFPLSVQLAPAGMRMTARIYAFKEDKASTYIKDEGVIFTINGQAHGQLPRSVFSRPKAVGLPRLKDSLLVLVDCSELDIIQREDLFMTSRDRLSKKPIRYDVEREIEEMLRNNAVLKELQQKRKESDLESKLNEEKPLEEVLGKVLKASPTLRTLFLRGQRLSRAFSGRGGGNGKDDGPNDGKEEFQGRRHPTYFKIQNREYGKLYVRNCEKERRCRIKFETDVENNYFDRATDKGRFELEVLESKEDLSPLSFGLSLEDGDALLNIALPQEVEVDDRVVVQASVFDPTLSEPFVSVVELNVKQQQPRQGGASRKKSKKKSDGENGEQPRQEGIALPRIEPVRENDKHWVKYKFNVNTATHVISDPLEMDGKTHLEHVFYINLDNNSLRTEMKYSKQDPRLLEAKFKYGNVLLGLAMLHEDELRHNGNGSEKSEDEVPVQDRIRSVTDAIAPVLLPMIDQLGGLNEDDLEMFSELGDDE